MKIKIFSIYSQAKGLDHVDDERRIPQHPPSLPAPTRDYGKVLELNTVLRFLKL